MQAHAAKGRPLDWVGLFALTVRTQWALLLRAGLLMLVNVATTIGQPIILEMLLDELNAATISLWRGLALACGIFALTVVGVVSVHSFWFEAQRAGIRSTIALSTEVFRRTLSLGPRARARFGQGQLTQLMGVDAERLASSYSLPLITWGSWPPLIIMAVGIWNLHRLLGWPALVAAAMLGSMPFVNAGCISGRIRAAQERVQRMRDDRIRAATEAIANVRALKVLGWEGAALRRVFRLRRRELRAVWADMMWRVASGVFVLAVPAAATSISFALFSLVVGRPMKASTVFAASAWIGALQGPLWQIPSAIRSAVSTSVSFARLADFFWGTADVVPLRRTAAPAGGAASGSPAEPGVRLSGVDISWPAEGKAAAPSDAAGAGGGGCCCSACAGWGSLTWVVVRMLGAAACCCCPPAHTGAAGARVADRHRGAGRSRPAVGRSVNADPEAAAPAPSRDTVVLADAHLVAGPGLTVVLGATGAGKSSLVGALTGDPLVSGPVPEVSGSLSYVGQRPWLSNATVRENIAFASPFCQEWFDVVVDACALREDMAAFPHGEDTQIGERGISISGGQRARIAMARALYSDSDVVLLDDPLAALDAKVASHVLRHCVMELLVDRGRAVVMCTNLLSLARHPRAAAVYLVEPGTMGGPGSVRPVSTGELATLKLAGEDVVRGTGAAPPATMRGDARAAGPAADVVGSAWGPSELAELSRPAGLLAASSSAGSRDEPLVGLASRARAALAARAATAQPTAMAPMVGSAPDEQRDLLAYAADAATAEPADAPTTGTAARGARAEETSEAGFVRLQVFCRYCAACGPPSFTAAVALALALRETLMVATDVWLTVWVDAKGGSEAPEAPGKAAPASSGAFNNGIALKWMCGEGAGSDCYAVVYSSLQGGMVVVAVAMWLLVSAGSVTAARRMHDDLMTSLMRAKQSFFDATPTGLVVNRAVKDMQKIDLSVGSTVRGFVINALRLTAAVLLVSAGSPWVILAMAVLGVPYYALALRFRHAARDLQRLSSASNSPLLSLFGEISKGSHVVRTFGADSAFVARHRVLALSYATRTTLLIAVEQWATVWLECFGAIIVLATAVLLVVARAEGVLPVAIVGFLLTQAQSVPPRLLWVTRQYASLELALVAAERIFEFEDLPSEAALNEKVRPTKAMTSMTWCCSWLTGRRTTPRTRTQATPHVLSEPLLADLKHPKHVLAPLLPAGSSASVELVDVVLEYTGVGTPALNHVSLFIPAGAKVAIVGRSGAGKSSILAALLQTHKYSGSVRVGGEDTSNLIPAQARLLFATLSQEAAVFEGSARGNILGIGDDSRPPDRKDNSLHTQVRSQLRERGLGATEARGSSLPAHLSEPWDSPGFSSETPRDALALKAIKAVGLSDRLSSLDDELGSTSSLSRGQAQLLGLARCLVRLWESGCGVVLADEATSSVDRGSDTRVHDVLFELPQTIISICHRLDHIDRFDTVIVMSAGRVAEVGSPGDLIADGDSRLASLVRHFNANAAAGREVE